MKPEIDHFNCLNSSHYCLLTYENIAKKRNMGSLLAIDF